MTTAERKNGKHARIQKMLGNIVTFQREQAEVIDLLAVDEFEAAAFNTKVKEQVMVWDSVEKVLGNKL